jgi:hypothetical protein
MFCLKGTVSQDFLLSGFFHESSSPRPREIKNLWTYKMFYICGPSACVAIRGFANFGPNIFCNFQIFNLLTQICCGLKTSANLQILYFSAYKYIPKMF